MHDTRGNPSPRNLLPGLWRTGVALLLLSSLTTACRSDKEDDGGSTADTATPTTPTPAEPPTVLSSSPADGAIDVALNGPLSVTFSAPMDGASLDATTFLLTRGDPPVPVAGTVVHDDTKAFFWPNAHLASDTEFSATITTGAESAEGIALADAHHWTFSTGALLAPGLPVNLGTAGDFAILAKSGVSTVPPSAITGDLGLSPAAATYYTGFSQTQDASAEFSTSTQVTGALYASDDAPPTPSLLTTAVGDMQTAFTDAAGRAPDVTELGAGNIGGMTLTAGVYRWGTGLLIPTDLTLIGSPTDVWIFQVAQDLTVESGTRVTLTGGALPEHVFWQVAGFVDLGTTAHLEGIVLSQTSVTLRTGASVDGRLLAQTAVDLDASTVVAP